MRILILAAFLLTGCEDASHETEGTIVADRYIVFDDGRQVRIEE